MADESNFEKMGQWTRERLDLIKKTICPKGISDDEFALFVEKCRRSGLDPLLSQAFCVARRQNIGTRDTPNWVTKHEFQPSEAGLLARAEHFPDFRGIQASAVYAEDEILVDQGKGEVTHRFNPAKRKGALVGAWARLLRDGKVPVVVWLDFGGYVQQTPLWSKLPLTMIEKCARVAALRKAYPEAFGGLYVAGERPDDGQVEEPEAEASPVPRLTRPVLPEETATRLATPTLERAPDAVLVGVEQSGGSATQETATALDESALQADSICAEAASVVDAARAAGDEAALARARADLEALAIRARKLPKDTAARTRAAKALQEAKAQLKGGAA